MIEQRIQYKLTVPLKGNTDVLISKIMGIDKYSVYQDVIIFEENSMESDIYINYIDFFCQKVIIHEPELNKIGITSKDLFLHIIFYCGEECGYEFLSSDLLQLGKLGIDMGISYLYINDN